MNVKELGDLVDKAMLFLDTKVNENMTRVEATIGVAKLATNFEEAAVLGGAVALLISDGYKVGTKFED